MPPGYYLKRELGKKWQNLIAPTSVWVCCLFPLSPHLTSPPSSFFSSVRQLSYWHSHHLLRTRWISFLQKSFALCQSQGCSHLPGHFPFSPFSSLLFLPRLLFPPISTSLRTRRLQSTLSALSSIHLHLSGLRFIYQSSLFVKRCNHSEI